MLSVQYAAIVRDISSLSSARSRVNTTALPSLYSALLPLSPIIGTIAWCPILRYRRLLFHHWTIYRAILPPTCERTVGLRAGEHGPVNCQRHQLVDTTASSIGIEMPKQMT